jgi:O-antigen/teichoic acid export membrane protein
MGIVIRQSAKSVILTYLGIGVGVINTLWLFPYILNAEQIGLVRTLINVSLLFSTFACLGAGNLPIRFFPYFKDMGKQHNGFLYFLLILGGIGFVIFTILLLSCKSLFVGAFIQNSPLLLNYFYLLIPFTFIMLFTNIFESYNVIQQNPVMPIFTREVLTRAFLSLAMIAFFLLKFQYDLFVSLVIIFYGVVLLVLIAYTKSQKYLFLKPNNNVFKSTMLKSIIAYSGFVLIGNTSGVIINNVDSLMLSAYKGLTDTGIYSIAVFIATFIEIPKKSLSQVLIPLVSEASKNNQIKTLNALYKKSSITQLIIGGLIFILVWFNIDNIYRIIPNGDIYLQGKWVVFYIGLGKMFDMTTGINQEIIGSSKYYKIDLSLFPLYSLIAVGANILFIKVFNLNLTGAALATASTVFVINIVRSIILFTGMRIQPFAFSTIKALLIFIIAFILNYFLPHIQHHFILDIIFRSLIVASVFTSLVLLLKVSEDINMIMNKIISKLLPNYK